ncbi:MAG: hypothetical protein KDC80_25755 [Saprospiraceae bacterium]|nr:hypothetical protein [Saprospiraceae bacterium]
MEVRIYPAKILLFGEYTVLFGGQAMAIPYAKYGGRWIRNKRSKWSDLTAYFTYLREINTKLRAPLELEILDELENHWKYESNIPIGMGLGSSASITASVYQIAANPGPLSLIEKKADLALIESFFHGKSSGFDPLVSFENKCIVQSNNGIQIQDEIGQPPFSIYLIYTRIKRDAQKLINQFRTHCENTGFRNHMEELAIAASAMVDSFIQKEWKTSYLHDISALQYEHMDFLIPPEIREIWKNILNDPNNHLKLCGAGGGGCYLLFSSSGQLPNSLGNFHCERIDLGIKSSQ